MRILPHLRDRTPRGGADGPGPALASSLDEAKLPIANYDNLDGKQLRALLSPLSQLELAVIDDHERAHKARPVVLNRLHWLKGSEPVEGYDALTTEEIVRALAEADTGTAKAVRDYERRHRDRHEVRAEIARVLPTAQASAAEDRAREAHAALVQEGFAGRKQAGEAHTSRRAGADAQTP